MIGIRAWGLAGHLGPTARTFVTAAEAGHLAPRAPVGAPRLSPLGAARSRWLDDALAPADRAHHLALEALRPAIPRELATPLLLVVAWPDELGGRPTSAVPDHRILRSMTDALGAKLDPSSLLCRGDRVAFARAVSAAIELADAGAAEVVVGAVDTPVDCAALERLDREERLAGPQRPEGCIPGEVAAFLRLSRERRGLGGAAIANVAVREAARASAPGAAVDRVARAFAPDVVVPDVNGERARTKDWLDVSADARDALAGATSADWLAKTGDARTATGAMLAAVALETAFMKAGPFERAVISLLGDDGARGAIALSLPRAGGAFRATTVPTARSIGRSRRIAEGRKAAALAHSLAAIVEEVAGLLLLDLESAEPRLARQLDAAAALGRPGPRAAAMADLRGALAAFSGRSPPVARAASWVAARFEAPPGRASARGGGT